MRKREKAGDKRESVEKSNNKKRTGIEDIKRNEQMTKGTCRKVSVYILYRKD